MKTNDQPLISVIIPTHNREYCIIETINSVIKQSYQNWELIVIDNSTTSATRDNVTSYLNDPRISYHYQKNFNSSESLNYGIKIAQGEYLALLDDDDSFKQNKLEIQLSEMINYNAEFSLSNCIKVYDGKKSKPKLYPESFMITQKEFLQNKLHLSHTHLMFKASIKDECWFDPLLPASDDFDLIARILVTRKILFVAEPLSYINKSVKRKRISNNAKMKIQTFEELIKKISTYGWPEEYSKRTINMLTLRNGFWLMMDKQYELGRQNMRNVMRYIPMRKRIRYIILYILSYNHTVFMLTRKTVEQIWNLLAGRIKL
jgi:glycosyltransferase involved in cell wall biosynthesis